MGEWLKPPDCKSGPSGSLVQIQLCTQYGLAFGEGTKPSMRDGAFELSLKSG